jgi:ribosomal protein L11 methyltransferase
MNWQQFTMQLGALSPELVEAVFERHGACSVTLSDAGDDPVFEPAPGETRLWADTRITGLFGADTDLGRLHDDLLRSFMLQELPGYRVESLPERDWEREWLKDFRPMAFGRRLWICPGGFEVDATDAVVVRLDPGLAFGTGTHPTTALCLEWLDSIDLKGCRVLDYGCGSGILAIAALLLGAQSAVGFDIDPQAITASRQNAARNGVADRLTTTSQGAELAGQFNVLLANILASPLIDNAASISALLKPGGLLALSGILGNQVDAVRGAYRGSVQFAASRTKDDWVLLTGQRF